MGQFIRPPTSLIRIKIKEALIKCIISSNQCWVSNTRVTIFSSLLCSSNEILFVSQVKYHVSNHFHLITRVRNFITLPKTASNVSVLQVPDLSQSPTVTIWHNVGQILTAQAKCHPPSRGGCNTTLLKMSVLQPPVLGKSNQF